MPRKGREKSSTGIYHIMVRGINQQNIFEDDEDRKRYIETVERVKREEDYELYAYCLMSNHIHLLLKEKEDNLAKIMKKIGTSYVYYYNWKHERKGHLFQDRYGSEVVENDEYFYTVIRYIHQNPVNAGLASIEDYHWSSYKNYIDCSGMINTEFFLDMLADKKEEAIKKYIRYMNEANKDRCLEIEDYVKLTDEKAREIIKEIGKLANISEIQRLDKEDCNRILKEAKEIRGISILQISRITGINRTTIRRA